MSFQKGLVLRASSAVMAAALLCVLSATSYAAVNEVKVGPTSLSFGNDAVGAASAAQTVTVTNTGRTNLSIQSVSLSSLQFVYSGPALPVTLGPGKSFSGSVLFVPTAAQKYSARLSFAAKQFVFGSTSVTLSGTGTAAAAAPKTTPTITWTAPAAINYGTALGAAQLNAAANTAGSFAYSSPLGTVLTAGSHTLSVAFTPTNTTAYNTANSSVVLNVNKVTPTITWAAPAAIASGTALSAAQLNASANTAGSFAYSSALGTVLSAGSHSLSVTFTPSDATDYNAASGSVLLTVNAAAPAAGTLTVNPVSVTFGGVNVGTSSSQTISVVNSGSGSVTISGVSISAAGVSASGVPAGTVLAGGQSASLNLTFAASSTGNVTGKVTIASNATDASLVIPVTASGLSNSVSLVWSLDSSATGGYNVYSSTIAGGPYNKLTSAAVNLTSFTDSTVQPGLTYYYVVTAVDLTTSLESIYSNQASILIP